MILATCLIISYFLIGHGSIDGLFLLIPFGMGLIVELILYTLKCS